MAWNDGALRTGPYLDVHGQGIPYGDPFVVPGPNAPIDSVRWEVFAESLQDYAILQSAGANPTGPLLAR